MAYLLDTDYLVILQQRTRPAFDHLTARLAQANPDEVFASIISFHEKMQGWLAFLTRSRSSSQIVMAYMLLGYGNENLSNRTMLGSREGSYGFQTAVFSAKYLLTCGGFFRLAYQMRNRPSGIRITDWLVT